MRALHYKVDGVEKPIVVRKGFETDFSSDPIGLLDWTKVDVAGVVHDYLYQHPGETEGIESRWREDVIWFKIARSGRWRAGRFSAALGFLGMRGFGWIFRGGPRQGLRKVGGAFLCLGGLGAAIDEVISCLQLLLACSKLELLDVIKVAICLSVLVPASIRLLLSLWRSWQRSRRS